MNYSYMLNGRTADGTLLKNHGFVQEGNCFSLRVELQNGLYTVIKICNNKLDVDVFDEIFHKKYTAFSSGHRWQCHSHSGEGNSGKNSERLLCVTVGKGANCICNIGNEGF